MLVITISPLMLNIATILSHDTNLEELDISYNNLQTPGAIKMLNKNTWGVKKVRGQEEPATKSSDIK